MRGGPRLPAVAGVLVEDPPYPPPLSVTFPPPSRTTLWLVLRTFAAAVIRMPPRPLAARISHPSCRVAAMIDDVNP